MKRKKSASIFLAAGLTLVFAALAGAAGPIVIDQAKIKAAGGFPYKINASGSYLLTGNLTVSNSADAIDVNVAHVTIDLNGFSITGPNVSTSGSGINGLESGALTVENGGIADFLGGFGVETGNNGIVRNVQANADSVGIGTGNASVISGNTANSNVSWGILCRRFGCVISGNTANAGDASDGAEGISCDGSGCTISGNTANSNFIGIGCNSGCLIFGNTSDNNSSAGITSGDSTTGYGENVLFGNGSNVNGGTSIGNNVCSGKVC